MNNQKRSPHKLDRKPTLGVGIVWMLLVLLLFAGGGMLLFPKDTFAASIVVDGDGSGGTCSIYDALQATFIDASVGNCPAGTSQNDVIHLTIDITLTQPLEVNGPVTIEGNGHTINGDNKFRVFAIGSGAEVLLRDMVITGGNDTGGGGIQVNLGGDLTVENSMIFGNTANSGGGIQNDSGMLTILNSTIQGNTADTGAGIENNDASELRIENSTITGNTATNDGGGIFVRGTATIVNSTISGNSANRGGAVSTVGTLMVRHSTISANAATTLGGGIINFGTLTVENSIIAAQNTGTDCHLWSGTATSNGYNIESDTSCGFTHVDDQQNVNVLQLQLQSLADNGGPTETMAIEITSVAFDAIPSGANGCGTAVAVDQRQFLRPNQGGERCDVGAYEVVTHIHNIFLPFVLVGN